MRKGSGVLWPAFLWLTFLWLAFLWPALLWPALPWPAFLWLAFLLLAFLWLAFLWLAFLWPALGLSYGEGLNHGGYLDWGYPCILTVLVNGTCYWTLWLYSLIPLNSLAIHQLITNVNNIQFTYSLLAMHLFLFWILFSILLTSDINIAIFLIELFQGILFICSFSIFSYWQQPQKDIITAKLLILTRVITFKECTLTAFHKYHNQKYACHLLRVFFYCSAPQQQIQYNDILLQ